MLDALLNDTSQYQGLLLNGLLQTGFLAVCVAVTGLFSGLIIALLRHQSLPVISQLLASWVYLCRNVPLIMLVALVHYGILPFLGYAMDFFFSAWLALSLSASAYFAEIIRGGFQSLRREEAEAAEVLGLNWWQKIVFISVPLITLRMSPALMTQCVSLVKDTSLASLIGVIELTRAAEIVYEHTFHEGEMLALVALVYFLICYSLSAGAKKLKATVGPV